MDACISVGGAVLDHGRKGEKAWPTLQRERPRTWGSRPPKKATGVEASSCGSPALNDCSGKGIGPRSPEKGGHRAGTEWDPLGGKKRGRLPLEGTRFTKKDHDQKRPASCKERKGRKGGEGVLGGKRVGPFVFVRDMGDWPG